MRYFNNLSRVNDYLVARKANGTDKMAALIKRAKDSKAELVVLSFTYENVEGYAKIDRQFQLFDNLFGVISQYELDELRNAEYNEENPHEDYAYWKSHELIWGLIELWVVDCFAKAIQKESAEGIAFYFKHNHDSMEILQLNECTHFFEQAEFELYVKNNQRNRMELLGGNY